MTKPLDGLYTWSAGGSASPFSPFTPLIPFTPLAVAGRCSSPSSVNLRNKIRVQIRNRGTDLYGSGFEHALDDTKDAKETARCR